MDRTKLGALMLLVATTGLACKSAGTDSGDGQEAQRMRILREEKPRQEQAGIPIDKQQDILLVLQQRDPTTTKCYADVLNRKGDRAFAGSVKVLIRFATDGRATGVQVLTTTLNSPEVEDCLVEKILGFDFPALDQPGEMDYQFNFRPAY